MQYLPKKCIYKYLSGLFFLVYLILLHSKAFEVFEVAPFYIYISFILSTFFYLVWKKVAKSNRVHEK